MESKNLPVMFTPLGGLAVLMTAAETLLEGELVYCNPAGANDNATKAPVDCDTPIGAVYSPASSGAGVWVVVAGIARVKPLDGVTAAVGNVIYCSSTVAGRVDQAVGLPAVAAHNREVGHYIDAGTGNGVATRAILHWN